MSSRREFLSAIQTAGILAAIGRAAHTPAIPIKAVAFDAFPILDPRPVFSLVEQLFPSKGVELGNLWRTRQFEYTWLRTLSRNYSDFWSVTEDALIFAATALQLELTRANRSLLMDAWLRLKCWPDAPAALRALKDSGLRLTFLSNMTVKMLESGIRNSGLEGLFDQVLSTDRVRAYKPDPRAYQMAMEVFGMRRQEIAFVAFAGWDAAGAAKFGYRTFWVNRQNRPAEELGATANAVGMTLDDLVVYLARQRAGK
jgi:2-haloacid dehalogenase